MTTRRRVQIGAALVVVGAVADLIAAAGPLPLSINIIDLNALGVVTGAVGLVLLSWSLLLRGTPGQRYSRVTALLALVPIAWAGATIAGAGADLVASIQFAVVDLGLVCGFAGGVVTAAGSLSRVESPPTPKPPPTAK